MGSHILILKETVAFKMDNKSGETASWRESQSAVSSAGEIGWPWAKMLFKVNIYQ